MYLLTWSSRDICGRRERERERKQLYFVPSWKRKGMEILLGPLRPFRRQVSSKRFKKFSLKGLQPIEAPTTCLSEGRMPACFEVKTYCVKKLANPSHFTAGYFIQSRGFTLALAFFACDVALLREKNT